MRVPHFVVSDIPEGTNAIIVLEYNDLSFPPLSSGGGHGKIGYWHLAKHASSVLQSTQPELASPPATTKEKARTFNRAFSLIYLVVEKLHLKNQYLKAFREF